MLNLKDMVRGIFTKGISGDGKFGIISGSPSTAPKRGTRGMLNAYSQLPWFRAVVGKISRSTSTQQWKVFVQKRDGRPIRNAKIGRMTQVERSKFISKGLHSGDIEELDSHPILSVLNDGNRYLPGSINLQVSQIHIDSVGESFFLKQRNGLGVVEEIIPLPPHWVISAPLPGGDPVYRISISSIQEEIPAEEIIWTKDPDPTNPYSRGSGMALSLIDEMETDEFAAKHTKAWFFNSARPDIIVSGDGLDRGTTKRLEEDWLSKNQGFMKRFKPYFMNTSVKVQELNSSFKDMQLIKLREFERDTIIQVFGVPPEILGIVENSNRATITSSDMIFAKHVLIPRLEMQRTVFQRDLVPEYDDRLILDYDSPLQEDDDFKLKVMTAQAHAFKIDEWRELAGFEELEDGKGEVYSLPFNLIISDSLTSETTLEPEPIVIEDEKNKTKAIDLDGQAFIRRILRVLRAQVIVDALTPSITATVQSFGETMASSIGGQGFSIEDPVVTEFLGTRSGNRIRSLIDNTTRKQLRNTLVNGFEAGENIDDLTKRVNRVFDTATSNRSRSIARTETVRAANFGSQEGMVQSGVKNKGWLSSRDSVTRDSHKPGIGLDGVVIPVRSNFKSPVTGAEGPHPGELGLAEDDVNCRCTLIPDFDDERSFKGITEKAKEAIWKAFDSQRMPFEKKTRTELNKGFEEQRKDVLAEMDKGI